MFILSPNKIFVVLIVAIIVLGPDKLPSVARQISSAWRTMKALRARLEEEARSVLPDLPDLNSISQAVTSPRTYLDRLADGTETGPGQTDTDSAPATEVVASVDVAPDWEAGEPEVPDTLMLN